MSEFVPRAGQRQVLAYTGGKLGISAVPGSGKTHTLAELAAKLVAEQLGEGQEILVVTLVNSAVDNFKRRIDAAIFGRGLLAGFGYRVRTLHGLAHDIVRERPGLVGLSEDFGIIDEREADVVRDDAVESWLHAHPEAADRYLGADVQGNRAAWVKESRWPSQVRELAAAFIKRAKDRQLTPEALLARLSRFDGQPGTSAAPAELDLARIGVEIYADYQRSLAYRGVVDFDDLIRLALLALQLDRDYLARLQRRWAYILEDEAQDSSRLQERILRLLVGETGNWVRVGDPNQAIYETFTTADPWLLRNFIAVEQGVVSRQLPESGRSQPAIIALANHLIDWVQYDHPTPEARKALQEPHIKPTPSGDPQPNPPSDARSVQLDIRDFSPEQELIAVADSLADWIEEQEKLPVAERQTCAALAPRNQRGFELIDLLKARGIPYVELLRSTSATRETAGALGNLLRCLADPTSARKLSVAFRVWRRDERYRTEMEGLTSGLTQQIARCAAVESYLWPRADRDWLAAIQPELSEGQADLLVRFREVAGRWHRAAVLPIDQLVLTLATDLFREPTELALAHKLALLLHDVAEAHPLYRLPELVEELGVIARNERRFLGFSGEDAGFDPPKGKVTVATMHKAKGLEWDRVYLMSVNNYDFPSGQAQDTYQPERWFVRDGLNLEAEALAQLEALAEVEDGRLVQVPVEGQATQQARLEYISERLRLLYVGISRARRELIITWNKGRRQSAKLQPAAAFSALRTYQEGGPGAR